MNREAILNRLRGLAAKTMDNGCTEAEALSAATMLASMMDRYGFDHADLTASGEPEEMVKRTDYIPTSGKIGNVEYVLTATADFCDCKVWKTKFNVEGRQISGVQYFGRESDAMMAVYLTHLFASAARRGWADYNAGLGAVIDPATGRPKAIGGSKDRVAFEYGMMARLSERLREMKAARNANVDEQTGRTGQSLVVLKNQVVERAFQELSMKFRAAPARKSRALNVKGYNAGRSAADRVNITPGIGGSSRQSAALTA